MVKLGIAIDELAFRWDDFIAIIEIIRLNHRPICEGAG